jgi:hypothetical protein
MIYVQEARLYEMNPSWIKRIGIFLSLFILSYTHISDALDVKEPKIQLEEKNIHVSFEFDLDPETVNAIHNGITKEIIFYIDIFRSWKIWPDKFITGRKIIRTLKSDPMKKEFTSQLFDGETLLIKRFNSFQSMMKWSLSFDHIYLANMKNEDSGKYFIKITAEARHRKIPSLISEIFFFLPAREFKISKDFGLFRWDKESGRVLQ